MQILYCKRAAVEGEVLSGIRREEITPRERLLFIVDRIIENGEKITDAGII